MAGRVLYTIPIRRRHLGATCKGAPDFRKMKNGPFLESFASRSQLMAQHDLCHHLRAQRKGRPNVSRKIDPSRFQTQFFATESFFQTSDFP